MPDAPADGAWLSRLLSVAGHGEAPDAIWVLIGREGEAEADATRQLAKRGVLGHVRWIDGCADWPAAYKLSALVVSLPNLSHWSVTVPLVFAGQFRYADKGIKDRTHLRWFSREGAVDLVGSSGLSIELVRSSIWKKAERLVNLLTLKLFQRHFTAQYFVIGRKA